MAGTTTNNSWDYPTSTDYVKDGATAIQTLATEIDTSTGKGLVAWQTWAPTLGGGWLNGNGTWTAAFCQIGKTVHAFGAFTLGTTTTKGSALQIAAPVTIANNRTGTMFVGRATTSGGNFLLLGRTPSNTSLQLDVINSAATYASIAGITATVPVTWATGDTFTFSITYEAA